MRDSRLLIQGTSVLTFAGGWAEEPRRPARLRAIEDDVYGRLARRRRKAQMAARRALGVHDDLRRTF